MKVATSAKVKKYEKRHRDTDKSDLPASKRICPSSSKHGRFDSDKILDTDMDDYNTNLCILDEELLKDHPKHKVLRRLMASTFLGRRKWVLQACPPVQERLIKFPLLKKSKYVRLHQQ